MKSKHDAGVKVKVTERALLARINRLLVKQDSKLLKSRSALCRQDCGDYYVIDTRYNAIIEKDVDLEEIGRRLKTLKPYEDMENRA